MRRNTTNGGIQDNGSRSPGCLALMLRGFATDPLLSAVSSLRRRSPAGSLDVFGSHPDPNVRRAIAKGDAVAGLEFLQKAYGVAVG